MAGASDGATFVVEVTTDNEGSGAMVPAAIVVAATSLVGPTVVLSGARPVPEAPTATEPMVAPITAAAAIATARGTPRVSLVRPYACDASIGGGAP